MSSGRSPTTFPESRLEAEFCSRSRRVASVGGEIEGDAFAGGPQSWLALTQRLGDKAALLGLPNHLRDTVTGVQNDLQACHHFLVVTPLAFGDTDDAEEFAVTKQRHARALSGARRD